MIVKWENACHVDKNDNMVRWDILKYSKIITFAYKNLEKRIKDRYLERE